MTKIKLCGLTRPEDIQAANALQPACVGFVFAPKSKQYVTPAQAADLKRGLDPAIRAVGVFVNAPPEEAAALANEGVIDLIQLHGGEGEAYLQTLRALTPKPILQAFRVDTAADVAAAEASGADLVLLDAGEGGTGETFDWSLLAGIRRPYFLAGGLHPGNVGQAVRRLHPFGVDVSSGIETDGKKDPAKMEAFVRAVREEEMI